MIHHYLLWATGADRTGIVAAVAQVLYEQKCNIEDSSMLRLGSEFVVLLIFSSPQKHSPSKITSFFKTVEKKYSLALGVKTLTKQQAAFRPAAKNLYMISLHGADRPGLVYRLTKLLARHKFNVTDLVTHRTTQGPRQGYVLFVEGELPSEKALPAIERDLAALEQKLATRIQIRSVEAQAI